MLQIFKWKIVVVQLNVYELHWCYHDLVLWFLVVSKTLKNSSSLYLVVFVQLQKWFRLCGRVCYFLADIRENLYEILTFVCYRSIMNRFNQLSWNVIIGDIIFFFINTWCLWIGDRCVMFFCALWKCTDAMAFVTLSCSRYFLCWH